MRTKRDRDAGGGREYNNKYIPPLEIRILPSGDPWSRWLPRLTLAFVVFGLIVRLVRYLVCYPIWPDEAFLAANFLNGGYGDLLGTLRYHQISPLLFLWAEMFTVRLLGFSEYTLRLFPLLCGLGSVLVFCRLGRRLFRGEALLLAMAFFAAAYYPIRHGAEIKPYATDLAVSVLLLALFVEWWRKPGKPRRLWFLALAVPFAVGLSFPAVFVAGGISIALLAAAAKTRKTKLPAPFIAYNLLLLGAFLLTYRVSTGPQYRAEAWLSGPHPETGSFNQDSAWVRTFPPFREPARLPGWLLATHTGMMFAYPNGGFNGGSTLTFVFFAAGAGILYSRRRRIVLLAFLAPFLLTFIAAALHKYPYGHNARFNLYLAPIICLLAGLGGTKLISLIPKVKTRTLIFKLLILLMVLLGLGSIAQDLLHPYKKIEDRRSREFARWFWTHQAEDAELVCLKTDLGLDFFPRLFEWGHSARYLCNQRIYSPAHREGRRGFSPDAVSGEHPLRCVVFSVPECYEPYARRDENRWQEWLASMQGRYRLTGHEKFEVNAGVESHHECYEVYEFIP
ncbi:MAG: glycosyltransferase family 39 protein [PVC group bacterium]